MFCGEGVPPYEVNSRTVDILYDMAVRCEERERQAGLLLADMEQKTREYEAESEYESGYSVGCGQYKCVFGGGAEFNLHVTPS